MSWEDSKSAISLPFVCKWSGDNLKRQYLKLHANNDSGVLQGVQFLQYPCECSWRFNTQKDLKFHVDNDHEDLSKLEVFHRGSRFYLCPWEGCKKKQSNITKLKEHLHQHTQQKRFKCPICNSLRRFGSLNTLSQHLIINHNDCIVDSTGANDMTNCDDDTLYNENEKQKIGKVNNDEIDLVKEEINNYEVDLLIKGKANNDNKLPKSYADAVKKSQQSQHQNPQNQQDEVFKEKVNKNEISYDNNFYRREQLMWDLFWKGISYLEESEEGSEYDFDNENYDDLPDAPKEIEYLTEIEKDNEMWKSFCGMYKGSKAVEFLTKAREVFV